MADDWLSHIWIRPDGTASIAFNRLTHEDAMEHLRLFVRQELAKQAPDPGDLEIASWDR